MLLSYPYFFSKINRFDSLGFFSVIEEKDSNVLHTFSSQRRTDQFDSRLLAGEKAIFKVKSSDDNLGIVLARFESFGRVGKLKDRIIFRIKEEGKANWYYENIYRSEEFQPNEYFTFGFPPITDSKNKVYVFEFESISGKENAVGISRVKPQVALVYGYARNELKDINSLFSFISKKLIYVVKNVNFLQNWQFLALFVLPFLFVLFMKNKKIKALDKDISTIDMR